MSKLKLVIGILVLILAAYIFVKDGFSGKLVVITLLGMALTGLGGIEFCGIKNHRESDEDDEEELKKMLAQIDACNDPEKLETLAKFYSGIDLDELASICKTKANTIRLKGSARTADEIWAELPIMSQREFLEKLRS